MDVLTMKQAAGRLGVGRDTALSWLRNHAKLRPVWTDRKSGGRAQMLTYCVPVTAVDYLIDAIDVWLVNPDHITVRDAATMLELSPGHMDWLIQHGKIELIPPPEGLPRQYWAGKYKRRVSLKSVLAYKERNKSDETGT